MLGTPSSLFPFLFLYAKAIEGQVNSVIFAGTEYGFILRPICLLPVLLLLTHYLLTTRKELFSLTLPQLPIPGFNIISPGISMALGCGIS